MLLGSSTVLSAQSNDGRWLPFVGCWEALGSDDEGGLLCFAPANGGVVLNTFVDGEIVSTEQLVADGQQRTVAAEGCEGWESVEFSQDGRRAFTRTEFDCGTAQPRTGTGVMAFTAPNMWVDVRALDVDGEPVAWMQEYLLVGIDRLAEEGIEDPAADLRFAVRSARMAAAAPIGLDDVEEGAAFLDDRAVETWIVAQGDGFDPSADDLLRLSRAGLSDTVIDAVVAVSYPENFMVEAGGTIEQAEMERAPRAGGYRGYMAVSPYWGPRWGGSYGYGAFGYRPYGYNPFLYGGGYGGYYDGYGYGYWGSRPGAVIITRRSGSGGTATPQGYRRSGTAATGRSAQPRSGGAAASSGGSRSSGSAGSSSSGSSGGRTAKPRRRSGGEGSAAPRVSAPTTRPTPAARTAKPRRRTGG